MFHLGDRVKFKYDDRVGTIISDRAREQGRLKFYSVQVDLTPEEIAEAKKYWSKRLDFEPKPLTYWVPEDQLEMLEYPY